MSGMTDPRLLSSSEPCIAGAFALLGSSSTGPGAERFNPPPAATPAFQLAGSSIFIGASPCRLAASGILALLTTGGWGWGGGWGRLRAATIEEASSLLRPGEIDPIEVAGVKEGEWFTEMSKV